MSKPLLLSGGSGKVQELVGTATGQTVVWSAGPNEWVLGTPSSSGGGGVTWYLNKNTTAGSPTTNLPTGASGVVVKNLSATPDGTSTTAASTSSVPVLPAAPEIIAGFVTDATVPGLTGIPAGLWDFNIWAQANGNNTNQSYIQFKVYKYDGSTAPTFLASSVPVYLYDPGDVTQYTASVLIPAGTSLLTTDRIYVEVVGGSTTSNRQIILHFGNGEPSHVHTTIQVPVNLATGVTGTLPVANGGTGVTTAAANTVFAGPSSGGNAAPSFRTLVASDVPSLSSVYLPLSGGTLTGKLNTVASAVGSAGLNLPHGLTPTSPVNGDMWTGTTNLSVRISGATQTIAALNVSNTFSGTNTFSNATNSFGTSTAAGTTGLATGATISGATKTVNVGTGGLAGSTTAITVGSTTGTSTTTLNGTVTFANGPSLPTGTTGVTQSAGNNTTALATTAFVTTAVAASSGAPYDLPAEIPGVPAVSTKVVSFIAVRPYRIASSGHRGGCAEANPTVNTNFTVYKGVSSIGTITFNSDGTFSSSIAQTDFAINSGRVINADQILPRLRDGRLDAAEWIGPYDDELLGLPSAARFYYRPGWWEPSTTNELMVSRRALAELPADLRLALQTACAETFLWTRREYDLRNIEALRRLRADGVQLRSFPPTLMRAFAQESERQLREQERQDPERFGYVAAEWRRFRTRIRDVIAVTQFSPEEGQP